MLSLPIPETSSYRSATQSKIIFPNPNEPITTFPALSQFQIAVEKLFELVYTNMEMTECPHPFHRKPFNPEKSFQLVGFQWNSTCRERTTGSGDSKEVLDR